MDRFIITKAELKGQEFQICALFNENKKLMELYPKRLDQNHILGNIYIGKVEHIVKNINAAFVQISPTVKCYLPLEDVKHPVFTKKYSSDKKKIAAGDELLVQVVKEAIKTKNPSVTTNFTLTGKYISLTAQKPGVRIFAKRTDMAGNNFTPLLEELQSTYSQTEKYGIAVSANVNENDREAVLDELSRLKESFEKLIDQSVHRTAYSLVYKAPPFYLELFRNQKKSCLGRVVTDDRTVFEEICAACSIPKEALFTTGSVPSPVDEFTVNNNISLQFYRDPLLSLSALYNLKEGIGAALSERVWLKSGAYLVIQPTEALTVIDVNTGKDSSKQEKEDHFLKVNLEASDEIARQLRLRNLSGIIVVDFVNLHAKDARDQLTSYLGRLLKEDPVQTTLVDITRLGLVEITRRKVRSPLSEILKNRSD